MRLTVGRIGRPHGVRGECSIEVRTDFADDRFVAGAVLETDPPDRGPLHIARVRWHGSRLCVAFAGVASRNAAEELRGIRLWVDSAQLPALTDTDEFYDHELVGMSVQHADGRILGVVERVQHSSAHELLVVRRDDASEVLVPFVRAIVPEVSRQGRVITLDPPEGLI